MGIIECATYRSMPEDAILINAADQPVEVARKLITAKSKSNLPPFIKNMIKTMTGNINAGEITNTYSKAELREIAQHLLAYADMGEAKEIQEDCTGIEKAMQYIKRYCEKHSECEETECRLFDREKRQCFLTTDVIPCDWEISGEKGE